MDDTGRRWRTLVVGLLILSLALNLYLFRAIRRIADRVETLPSAWTSALNSLESRVTSLQGSLSNIEAAQAWYSAPQIDVTPSTSADGQGASARLTWTFRELAEGATVGLSYRVDDGSWQEADVRRAGAAYEAVIPLPSQPQTPIFDFHFTQVTGRPTQVQTESTAPGFGDQGFVDYIIHASTGGVTKSGAPGRFSGMKPSGHAIVSITKQRNGSLTAEVTYIAGPAKKIDLLAVGDSGKQLSASLREPPHPQQAWTGTLDASGLGKLEKVGVRVELPTGEVFEKFMGLSGN